MVQVLYLWKLGGRRDMRKKKEQQTFVVILDLQRSFKDNREFLQILHPASFNTDILHDHDILSKTKKSLLVCYY